MSNLVNPVDILPANKRNMNHKKDIQQKAENVKRVHIKLSYAKGFYER